MRNLSFMSIEIQLPIIRSFLSSGKMSLIISTVLITLNATNSTSLQCSHNFKSQNHDDISSVSMKYDQNRCLVFVSSEMTFDEAELVCQENKGHLVDLDCSTESYIKDIFETQTFSRRSEYWIGLKRNGKTLEWVNGGTTHQCVETSWSLTSQDCIKMESNTLKWHEEDCDDELPFICILKNITDPEDVGNETESLTTQISPHFTVTTASPNDPDRCNTTLMETKDNGTVIADCGNFTGTIEHQALQNRLDDLNRVLTILLVVLGISLLINIIMVIVCLVQRRSGFHCCIRTVRRQKGEEFEMAPLQQSPQSQHSVPNILIRTPTVSRGTSENELYSCVQDEIGVPEKVIFTNEINEINIYTTPEENENIYEDQLSRRESETVMCSNSIYGQGSCQDLYEECDIDTTKGRQTFENNKSIDLKKTKDLDGYVNRNHEDFNECTSKSSNITLHTNASSNLFSGVSKQKMTNLEPISSSEENVHDLKNGTNQLDFNNDTLQSNRPKKEGADPSCSYSDFKITEPVTLETAGENVYGMDSATYLIDDSKLHSGSMQEITDTDDIYSNLLVGRSETVASDHENVYGIESASDPLRVFDENLPKYVSNGLTSHEDVSGVKSGTIITNNRSTQNLETGTFNSNTTRSSISTDAEEPIPIKKKRKHYVNTETNNGSTVAFQSITHTEVDPQMPNQDISPGEIKENNPPDYDHADISELENDTLPPFQKTERKELTLTEDLTSPFQNATKEELRLTDEFMQTSQTNNASKSKDGYMIMDEKVDGRSVSTQRSHTTSPIDQLGVPFEIGGEGQTEIDPGIQVSEASLLLDNVEKQPDDGYMLPLVTKGVSQIRDDYEPPLQNNGDVDEDDYSAPISHTNVSYINTSSPSCLPYTREKSKESPLEPINSTQIAQEPEDTYSSLHENQLDTLDDSTRNIYGLESASCLSKSVNNNCQHTAVLVADLPEPNDIYSNLNEIRQASPSGLSQNIYGLESATVLTETNDD